MFWILSQSLIWTIVICNTLMENFDHIIFPSSSILFPTHNEQSLLPWYTKKREKNLQKIFDKKINFTLQCSSQQNSKRKYEKPFKSNSWSDSKTSDEKGLKLHPWFLKHNIILSGAPGIVRKLWTLSPFENCPKLN